MKTLTVLTAALLMLVGGSNAKPKAQVGMNKPCFTQPDGTMCCYDSQGNVTCGVGD